jgi:hypothetical protein
MGGRGLGVIVLRRVESARGVSRVDDLGAGIALEARRTAVAAFNLPKKDMMIWEEAEWGRAGQGREQDSGSEYSNAARAATEKSSRAVVERIRCGIIE